ncbi:MAG: tRNA lysidine(34) synthetase TilS [Chloroflexi bacterium]|nr:tRNA lysidine(34) synthetase TilS [Chloroflexota bacterium]
MLENLDAILRDECRLTPDKPIVVGVSGGPDSLCLLNALREAGYPLVVAHFNHRLRPEADFEANAVEREAGRLNLPFVVESVDVRAFAQAESQSIEEASRNLRYRFLFAQARQVNAQAVAVGHTADDQVETVLMHFIRGAGLAGLKGMSYRTILPVFDPDIPLVRPLLDTWREGTLLYCAAHGLRPHIDPSNVSLNFFRNRLRHVLIPELEAYNPRFRETLWRTSHALSGDYAVLAQLLDRTWDAVVAQEGEAYVAFDAPSLAPLTPGLLRNLFRRAVEKLRPGPVDVDFAALQRAVDLVARSDKLARADLIGGLRLFREGDRLYVAGDEAQLPCEDWPQMSGADGTLTVPVPGQVDVSHGWQLSAERWDVPALAREQMRQSADPFEVWLDAKHLDVRALNIRPRRPGDRFQPLGMDGRSVKLSDFFINVKLPQRARDRWPLLCTGERIAWVPGYRPAHPFRLTGSTRQVVYLCLNRKNMKGK